MRLCKLKKSEHVGAFDQMIRNRQKKLILPINTFWQCVQLNPRRCGFSVAAFKQNLIRLVLILTFFTEKVGESS